MGLGRRVFTPGEVLTASNVMNYLQDQAVMSFAGTAARGSAIGTAVAEGMVSYLQDIDQVQVYDGSQWEPVNRQLIVSGTAQRAQFLPSPVQGDTVFRSDLGYSETYYDAHGTANPGGRGTASAWYPNQRNMGLVPIVPPTVRVSGGTATANTLGKVSFSSATSIALDSVFTTAYDNYKINFVVTNASANASLEFRFANAGVDTTAANWYGGTNYVNANSGSGIFSAANGTTGFNAGVVNSAGYTVKRVISEITVSMGNDGSRISVFSSGFPSAYAGHTNGAALYNVAQLYDGFRIAPASGNITGFVTVYGYNF